tara:strand:+ start:1234 stop:1866 length:633 start_codon:yes stop_codon:yes gene_type:complete
MKKTNKDVVINLSNETLDKIDLTIYDKYLTPKLKHPNEYNFYGKSGIEHYYMLAYLSTCYNGETLLDVGTHMGGSAMALSYNKNNKVITVDVRNQVQTKIDIPNIEFLIGDIMNSQDGHDLIHSTRFILYDTTHTGKLEQEFHDYLVESDWKGIVIWDDIKYRWTKEIRQGMVDFWDSIDDDKKINISKYAHWTETGLVWYGDKPEINLL